MSSSRVDSGSPDPSPAGVASRSGASARAKRSAHRAETRSATTACRGASPVTRTVDVAAVSEPRRTVACASTGSCPGVSSRQTKYTPAAGPLASSCAIPGTVRSRSAPSRSTTVRAPSQRRAPPPPGTVAARSCTRAASSETRRSTCASAAPMPTRLRHGSPCAGRVCGRYAVHVQSAPDCTEAARMTSETSTGECHPQTSATSPRTKPRDWSRGPDTPTTPTCASRIGTGTSLTWGEVGTPRWSTTTTREVSVPVPIRSVSRSSSCRRRSHSRAVGRSAASRRAARSGSSQWRHAVSLATAATTEARTRSLATACAATAAESPDRRALRSLTWLPTSTSGLISPNSSMVTLRVAVASTTARTRGSSEARTGTRSGSRRSGGGGSRNSGRSTGALMRGLRLTAS